MSGAVLSSILPVCLLLLLGAALCQSGFLPDLFFAHLNRLGFWVLLPTLLFCTILQAPQTASADGLKIGLLLCVCSVAVTAAAWLAARVMRLPDFSARALMQAAMRGNLAYTALPVILYAFGENSRMAAVASFAIAPAIPFYNFWAVVILTSHAQDASHGRQRLRAALAILQNPLIIGCLLGVLALKSGIRLPRGLLNAVSTLGHAALPCALMALGAGLTFERLRASFRPALIGTALKLLLMPALGYVFARAAGFSNELLLVALLFLASPCAVTSYVMADQMGADKELAGSAIVLSTALCLPVMAALLLMFSSVT
ncbi:MAG TPA: AEC family transporter [Kiritimatiellia bacterium]|nr:AEC family transporter [Kiritimatiellia bacterium]HRU70478.1 AEC family transporter [Kiritimatiellia bacterium]